MLSQYISKLGTPKEETEPAKAQFLSNEYKSSDKLKGKVNCTKLVLLAVFNLMRLTMKGKAVEE